MRLRLLNSLVPYQLLLAAVGASGCVDTPTAPIAGSVSDKSGNTYPTVQIGTQLWMAENLRTTKYNDGTSIPLVTDATLWNNNSNNNTTLPMMVWYNNDKATYAANKFGALYNWYAINPTTNGNKNVCPTGWHVPRDAEWNTLMGFLDPAYNPSANGPQSATAGGKMKTTGTQYWQSPNTGAVNESGFSGLPGGYIGSDGAFNAIGYSGFWWSSSEDDTDFAYARDLIFINSEVNRNGAGKRAGLSVRCLRD